MLVTARARPLRARDGLQRDLGVGRARERQPARLRRAAGDLRAHRRRAARRRLARCRLRAAPRARADASSSPRSSSASACSPSARASTARAAGSTSARSSSSRPSSRSSRSSSGRPPISSRTAAAAHAQGARAAARAPRRSSSPCSCSSSRTSAPRSRSSLVVGAMLLVSGTRLPTARDRVRDRDRARRDRRVVVAVPPRPAAHVPRPVEGPDRRRPPERAGADQPRLRRDLRPRPRPGHREAPLPARGAHGHDVRRHRRGARPRRRARSSAGVLRLRLRGDPARDRAASDPFAKRLAAGITALVCGQAAINIAAVARRSRR